MKERVPLNVLHSNVCDLFGNEREFERDNVRMMEFVKDVNFILDRLFDHLKSDATVLKCNVSHTNIDNFESNLKKKKLS